MHGKKGNHVILLQAHKNWIKNTRTAGLMDVLTHAPADQIYHIYRDGKQKKCAASVLPIHTRPYRPRSHVLGPIAKENITVYLEDAREHNIAIRGQRCL